MAKNVGLNKVVVIILHRGSDCTFMIFNVENANIKPIVNSFALELVRLHKSMHTQISTCLDICGKSIYVSDNYICGKSMYVSDNYSLYFCATMYYVRSNYCSWYNPMVLEVGIIWVVCTRKPACYIFIIQVFFTWSCKYKQGKNLG